MTLTRFHLGGFTWQFCDRGLFGKVSSGDPKLKGWKGDLQKKGDQVGSRIESPGTYSPKYKYARSRYLHNQVVEGRKGYVPGVLVRVFP